MAVLPNILYAYQILMLGANWGYEEIADVLSKQMAKTDRGLIAFLTATLPKQLLKAHDEYTLNPAWERYLQDIDAFIPRAC